MDRRKLERRMTIAAFIVSTSASLLSFYASIHLGLARYAVMGVLWAVPSVWTGLMLAGRTS